MKKNKLLVIVILFCMNFSFILAQTDHTDSITNPSFETGNLDGWTVTGATGYSWIGTGNDGDGTQHGTYNAGLWNRPIGDVEWSQSFTALPNGFYKVGCLMTVTEIISWTDGVSHRSSTQRLFAFTAKDTNSKLFASDTDYSAQNLQVIDSVENYSFANNSFASAENGPFYPMSVVVEVTDGSLTLGARVNGNGTAHLFDFAGGDTDKGFFKIDNFTLFCVDTATIDTIIFNAGSLDGSFNQDVYTYSATLPKFTTSVTPSVVFTADGISATGLDPVDVSSGTGTSDIEVTCLNGITKTYTVNYSVLNASNDATLLDLSLSTGTLSPTFSADVTDYTGIIPVETDSVKPTAVVYDGLATLGGDQKIELKNGHGKSEIIVTAEDGITTKTYTVFYDYEYLTNPSFETGDLTGWTLTGADGYSWTSPNNDGDASKDGDYITGVWNSTIGDVEWAQDLTGLSNGYYKVGCLMTVSNKESNRRLTTQRLFANSKSALYGFESDYSAQNLVVLDSTENYTFACHNTSEAENGPFFFFFFIVEVTDGNLSIGNRVNGFASSHAFDFISDSTDNGFYKFDNFSVSNISGMLIKSLTIDGETVDNIDSTNIYIHNMTLPHNATDVPVISATAETGILVNIIPCDELPGRTEIVMSLPDSSYSLSYYVDFSLLPSNDATLSDLSTSVGELSPGFDAAVLTYDLTVLDTNQTVTFTAIPNDDFATVAGDGVIDLTNGDTTVVVAVTAEDKSTLTYSVAIALVAPYVPSSDATLSDLTTTVGSLSPAFASTTLNYDLEVPAGAETVILTATPSHDSATVTGDGFVDLSNGEATARIVVLAADSSTQTYVVEISKATSVFTNYQDQISVYPTISGSDFYIQGIKNGGQIEVYRITGQLVISRFTTSEDEILRIENKGVYIIKVIHENQNTFFKVVKI